MENKHRDFFLAVLSVGGVFYLIASVYGLIFEFIPTGVSLTTLHYLVLSESLFFLILGVIVWKKIKLSDEYSKYFLILFLIVLVLDLLRKLVIIF